jgi:hypothetical protein
VDEIYEMGNADEALAFNVTVFAPVNFDVGATNEILCGAVALRLSFARLPILSIMPT